MYMALIRRRRVMRKRRAGPKRAMRKRGVGRARVKRQSDYATCVEIQETAMVAVNDRNNESVGAVVNFCLQDYQRPQEIAHAYKYYRAAKCEITWIPYYNIAQTGGAANTRMPQLYYSVDRLSNRWIAPTETECLERGMSPKVFNKKFKLSFKPNLVQGVSLETRQPSDATGVPQGIDLLGYQNGIALFDKWLPTQQSFGYQVQNGQPQQVNQVLAPLGVNPYALRYHGAIFCPAIEGLGANTSATVGDIQVKITWEFKGPRALATNAPLPEPNPFVTTSSQGNPGAVPNTQPTTYP